MPLTQAQVQADQGNAGANPWPVDVTNTVPVTTSPSTTATIAAVPSLATSETILAANPNRKGAAVFNDSSKTLFLAAAASASSVSYTVQVAPKGYFEVPFGYTGILTGIWSAVNGNALVTEFT